MVPLSALHRFLIFLHLQTHLEGAEFCYRNFFWLLLFIFVLGIFICCLFVRNNLYQIWLFICGLFSFVIVLISLRCPRLFQLIFIFIFPRRAVVSLVSLVSGLIVVRVRDH